MRPGEAETCEFVWKENKLKWKLNWSINPALHATLEATPNYALIYDEWAED